MTATSQRRADRMAHAPAIPAHPDLPIIAAKDAIIAAIRRHPVVVVAGETGSGKTTQIPKFCLAAGRGIDGMIGCTQPRRIAAVTVAERIAQELGEPLGRSVGYKIRFHEEKGLRPYVKVMTDGILLAETQSDRNLAAYDTLIIDEAHERSLNIDFVLGILKTLIKRRKDLKLIITSATIDTEKFSKAFGDAPVIEVTGRTYPVELRYEPGPDGDESTHVERAALAVDRLLSESRSGDILVFMPTEGDIRDTIELIEGRGHRHVTVLPLFARLSAADQHRVFSSPAGRKIIVSTNIAETSLTIPGIKFVVDTGLARISQYNPRTRTTGLPVTAISQSSADQRMGRCGRVQNGICVRLYAEADYRERPRFTRPEILRANLAAVILRMISLGLGEVSRFPFLDAPAAASIQDGFNLLLELGAITTAPKRRSGKGGRSPASDRPRLTEKGRRMAAMPIDPRLSCMMIEAADEGCPNEIAVIAAALSIQDPRERPADRAAEADRAHARFKDPASDFATLLTIWKHYRETWEKRKKMADIKRFCTENFLSFKRMREWRDIHNQLCAIMTAAGGDRPIAAEAPCPAAIDKEGRRAFSPVYEKIHKAVLSGFLSNIAQLKEGNVYQAAKGRVVMVFPGSGLFNASKRWIVAAEMVETSRLFARSVAHIDPAWIEPLGRDRCRYTYCDPHWERAMGTVVATEQVSLFGLVINPGRKVLYGRTHPEEATRIFIESALVAGDVRRPLGFMTHNRQRIESVQALENRIRRRDLLIDEADLFQFYESRIGGIYDIRSLTRRIKKQGGDDFLRLREEDLLRYAPDTAELALYPDGIRIAGEAFPCDYRFDPGAETDGVTVRIPAAQSGVLPPEGLDWLVPGLFREKVAALIKALPKTYRKQLVPVADTVEIILAEMEQKEGSLLSALGAFIHRRFGVDIPVSAWSEELLPDHLRMRIAITAPDGRQMAASRDASILRQDHGRTSAPEGFGAAKEKWEKTNIRAWNFGDLPERLPIEAGKNGALCIAYPALTPDPAGSGPVSLRLYLNPAEAMAIHRDGVRALFTLHLSKDLKLLKKMITLPKTAQAQAACLGGEKRIQTHLIESVTRDLFSRDIRTREAFESHLAQFSREIVGLAQKRLDCFLPVLEALHELRGRLFELEERATAGRPPGVLQDIRCDLEKLAPEHLLTLYANDRLAHLPRYIRALGIRAARAVENPDRDSQRMAQIRPHGERLERLLASLGPASSEDKRRGVEAYFWMLEEFKVSVFAQELKTPIPISAKRLDKKAAELERMA